MPVYSWKNRKAYPVTPDYSVAVGKVVAGDRLICIDTLYQGDRGDGKVGAKTHSHPEEQIMVMLEGHVDICIDGEWTRMSPGDVAVIPPYLPHELSAISGVSYRMYNIKNRINGHSVYTYGAWEPGAKELNDQVESLLEESKKFPIRDPWFEEGEN